MRLEYTSNGCLGTLVLAGQGLGGMRMVTSSTKKPRHGASNDEVSGSSF